MAFDHHIEADKVDDLGFFATFLRAPVVGSLMWVFGGDAAKKKEQLQNIIQSSSTTTSCDDEHPPSILIKRPFHESEKFRRVGSGKRMPPRLTGSDISEIQAEAMVSEQDSSRTHNERSADSRAYHRESRSLSWSDETGRDLVQFIGEPVENPLGTSSRRGKPPPHSVPSKSAIRRTRSVKQNALSLDSESSEGESSETSRYIPKGLGDGHSGLRIPTKPFGEGSPQGTPSFSPEWGWYINTTPPTPEMYQSHASKKKDKSNTSAPIPPPVSHHDAFAKGFKKAAGEATNVGWPGVPL